MLVGKRAIKFKCILLHMYENNEALFNVCIFSFQCHKMLTIHPSIILVKTDK